MREHASPPYDSAACLVESFWALSTSCSPFGVALFPRISITNPWSRAWGRPGTDDAQHCATVWEGETYYPEWVSFFRAAFTNLLLKCFILIPTRPRERHDRRSRAEQNYIVSRPGLARRTSKPTRRHYSLGTGRSSMLRSGARCCLTFELAVRI